MNENDELLDLVDNNDVVVGTIRREDMVKAGYKTDKGYARFVDAFLINDHGEIWVPTRGLHKKVAPGGCDFSVAEHVLSGETYAEANERGFAEEAGLNINSADLISLGKLPPAEDKNWFEEVYLCKIRKGDSPKFSREEFDSAEWLSPEELENRLLSGPPTKSSLLPAFRLLQKYAESNQH